MIDAIEPNWIRSNCINHWSKSFFWFCYHIGFRNISPVLLFFSTAAWLNKYTICWWFLPLAVVRIEGLKHCDWELIEFCDAVIFGDGKVGSCGCSFHGRSVGDCGEKLTNKKKQSKCRVVIHLPPAAAATRIFRVSSSLDLSASPKHTLTCSSRQLLTSFNFLF